MWTVISSIVLGLIIAVPVYVLLSHFRSGRKSPKSVVAMSFVSFFCIVAALLLILLFSYGQDIAALIAMVLLLVAAITSLLIIVIKIILSLKKK